MLLVDQKIRRKLERLPKAFPTNAEFADTEEGTDFLEFTAQRFAVGKGVLAIDAEMSDREIGALTRIAMAWAHGKPFTIKQWGQF